jgi:hypothetical protein
MPKENISIILAVSDYGPTNSLPGCKNDGELVRAIIEKTGRFAPDNTLYLNVETSSSAVKRSLSRFIGSFNDRQVGEIFYFYTGHGLFDGTDFYYLLSDYSPARQRATTLTNVELDEMLRSLRADLTVKVIDACYSAQQYVKSVDEFEKAIKASSATYKNCYFMFSSEQTQASWQDGNFSHFTFEFAKAIQQHASSSIRYKDIIDFISDAFASNARQRPVFVAQANFTEEFCAVDDSLKAMINSGLVGIAAPVHPGPITTPRLSAADELSLRIRKDAERYCTAEDAEKTLGLIKEVIGSYKLSGPVADFYALRQTFMSEYQIPNAQAIGDWLNNNPGDFFGKVVLRQESSKTVQPVLRNAFDFSHYPEYRTVTMPKWVVSGFDSTVKMSFKAVQLLAEPSLQNVPWWKWYCAFLVSKTDIACFETDVRLKEINWQEQEEQGKIEWRIGILPLKNSDVIESQLHDMLDRFATKITRFLMEKYGLDEKDHGESANLSSE